MGVFSDYVARGFSVIPLPYRKKKAVIKWKQYQTEFPTSEECARWDVREKFNVALICGSLSGVVCIDLDSAELIKTFYSMGKVSTGPKQATERGIHLFFKHPGEYIRSRKLPNGIDVKADGGLVTVAPSVHSSGKVYEFVDGIPLAKENLLDMPDWLLEMVREPKHKKTEWPRQNAELSEGTLEYWLGRAFLEAQARGRNEGGLWFACQLRDLGVARIDAEFYLSQYQQQLEHTDDHPYLLAEIIASADEAYSRSPRTPPSSGVSPRMTVRQMYPGTLSKRDKAAQEKKAEASEGSITNRMARDVLRRELIEQPVPDAPPYIFPFRSLHRFGGFFHVAERRKMVYVVGIPGGGKTSMAEIWMGNLVRDEKDVLSFGPEWSPTEVQLREMQRRGGLTYREMRLDRLWRSEEAKGIPEERRSGRQLSQAQREKGLLLLDQLDTWPGMVHHIEDADYTLDSLLLSAQNRVDLARATGRDVVAIFWDYLHILKVYSHSNDAGWGERLCGMFKRLSEATNTTAYVLLQPKKPHIDAVRLAGINGKGKSLIEQPQVWLNSDSASGVSDWQCNAYLTITPEFDQEGKQTGIAVLNAVKNSDGTIGPIVVNTDFSRYLFEDKGQRIERVDLSKL